MPSASRASSSCPRTGRRGPFSGNPAAETLAFLGLEAPGGKPLDELGAVALVVEVDRDAQSSATPNSYQTRAGARRSPPARPDASSPSRPRARPRHLRRAGLRPRDTELAEPPNPARRARLLHFRGGVARSADRLETGDLRRGDRLVEAQGRRQAHGAERTVRDAVAAAEGLRHRVPEAKPRSRERRARVHGALEQLAARLDVFPVRQHPRQRGRSGRRRKRLTVGFRSSGS